MVEYIYDAASRLTGLTYKQGMVVLGDLTYTYDQTGRRIATGGSFARIGVPQAVSTAMYDAANQQLTLRTKTLNTSSLSRALGGTLFMA